MTPAQIIARVLAVLLLASACVFVYRQIAVELPAVRADLKAQQELTAAAVKAREEAEKQAKDLQADQAEIEEREAKNEAERRRVADPDVVLRRLVGVCQHAAGQLPGSEAVADPAGGVVAGEAEADDSSDGHALAGIAQELREVPSDDDNHEALAAQWCKLKMERGEPQPGCPNATPFATGGM